MDWLSNQRVIMLPFKAGDPAHGYDSLLVCPANADVYKRQARALRAAVLHGREMQLVAQVPQQLLIFWYLDLFAIDKKDSHCKNSLNLNFGSHVTEALFSAFRHRNSEF